MRSLFDKEDNLRIDRVRGVYTEESNVLEPNSDISANFLTPSAKIL